MKTCYIHEFKAEFDKSIPFAEWHLEFEFAGEKYDLFIVETPKKDIYAKHRIEQILQKVDEPVSLNLEPKYHYFIIAQGNFNVQFKKLIETLFFV